MIFFRCLKDLQVPHFHHDLVYEALVAKKTEEVVVGVPKGAWEKQGEGGGGGKPLMHSIQQQAMIKRKQTFMKMKSRTSSM